jgi:hypothetical protein
MFSPNPKSDSAAPSEAIYRAQHWNVYQRVDKQPRGMNHPMPREDAHKGVEDAEPMAETQRPRRVRRAHRKLNQCNG